MGDKPRDSVRSFDGSSGVDRAALLQPLADELLTIATKLKHAAADASATTQGEAPKPGKSRRSGASTDYLALARKTYALRRKRTLIFGNPELFGEPAWDILLDLFIAHAEGKPVSVSSACIGSAAPATTGLRWLGILADEGLVLRENDSEDNRRVLVKLSPAGVAAMDQFFEAMQEGGW